ncbi:hypothetical protein WMF30_12385 [Sorangium sp. So ce134]
MSVGIDRSGARWSYERLRLSQPQVDTRGLWYLNGHFFVHCPNLANEQPSGGGASLMAWFASHRAMCAPIDLVAEVPPGAELVEPRSIEEISTCTGEPRTLGELYHDLALALPNEFPDFAISDDSMSIHVATDRALDPTEDLELRRAFNSLQTGLSLTTSVRRRADDERERYQLPMMLLTSKAVRAPLSNEVRWVIEADEDFWVDERTRLLSAPDQSPQSVLPTEFRRGSSCYVGHLAAKNLRVYLPIYKRVQLEVPIREHQERWLAALRVSLADIIALAQMGRVQLILPQSFHRYDAPMLNAFVSEVPKALLFSRRLAGACIVDSSRRILLQPGVSFEHRAMCIRVLDDATRTLSDGNQRRIAQALRDAYQDAWLGAERAWNRMGAMAPIFFGVGHFLASVYKSMRDIDLTIELSAASRDVMFGAALGSTVFPIDDQSYSAQVATELCASTYSGVPNQPIPTNVGDVETVVSGLLGIDDDVPIVDMASNIDGRDVDRFRDVVTRIGEFNLDPDYLNAAIGELNARVRDYERNVQKQARFDVVTVAGVFGSAAGAGALFGVPGAVVAAASLLPLGAWVLARLVAPDAGGGPGGWRDSIRALNAFTSRDAVLVSRLRKYVS